MRPKYRDKPWIRALLRCRTTAMAGWTLLAIMTAPNALAAWKTSNWEVSEPLPTECRERGDPNAKHPTLEGMVSYHQRVMQDASRWYERLGFPDPLVTRKNNKIQAQLIPDSNYEGSYYFFIEKGSVCQKPRASSLQTGRSCTSPDTRPYTSCFMASRPRTHFNGRIRVRNCRTAYPQRVSTTEVG